MARTQQQHMMKQRMLCPSLFCVLLFCLTSATAIDTPPHVAAASLIQQTRMVGSPSFGINAHLATRYPDPSTMSIPGNLLDELGVAWVREDFHFYRIQPRRDVWDWTFNDAALRSIIPHNIAVLGVIGGPSAPWATPYTGDSNEYASFYAPDVDAFVAFARGVVMRYHRYIHHWELWNEPDNNHFWKPLPDPAAYAELLIRTSAAIKAIDPQATILIGGINPFDSTFLRGVQQAGAWDSFDIMAIHPYIDPLTPEAGNIAAAADAVRVVMAQYGAKRLWATEVGWASGTSDNDPKGQIDDHEQARLLVRALLLLWESGVERSFWYTLKDDLGNPYGVIALGDGRGDYRQRKPAFYAFRTLNEQLNKATFQERRDMFRQQVVLPFTTLDDMVLRPVQPNGTLEANGSGTARLSYHFSTSTNDYVVFELAEPIALPSDVFGIGLWLYGDGSGHGVQVWLRDAEGELLQYRMGVVGSSAWHGVATPVVYPVQAGNVLAGNGNGRLDMPAFIQALVLDDYRDEYMGSGAIYCDALTVISGREVYDMRFSRGTQSLDIIWSPPGTRIAVTTHSSTAVRIGLYGNRSMLTATRLGRLSLLATGEPFYVWHQRE